MQEVNQSLAGSVVFFTTEWSLCALSTKNNRYLITKNLTNYTENPSYLKFKKKQQGNKSYFDGSIHSETKLHMACALKNKTTGDGDE